MKYTKTLFSSAGSIVISSICHSLCFSCDIPQPDIFAVMVEHDWQLDDLVHITQTKYHRCRELPPECRHQAQRDADAPHEDDVCVHVKFSISAGTEDAVQNHMVHRLGRNIQTAKGDHDLQIFDGLRG